MKGRFSALFAALTAVVLITAGCAGTRARSAQAPPGPERLSKAELNDRVEGLARFATGVHLELQGKQEAATKAYHRAAELDPSNETLALDVARRYIQEQKPGEAIALLEERAREEGASGNLEGLLALAYHQNGQTNKAVETGERALRKAPGNIAIYQHLSQLYALAGRTNEVLALIQKAAAREDGSAEFYLSAAELAARFQLQQIIGEDEARTQIMRALEQAGALDPEHPLTLQRLGDFYMMYGEVEKAEPFYAKLLESFPEAPGVRERLANIYLRLGRHEKAAVLLEELRKDKPTDPRNYYFLGSLAFDGKDFPKAAEYYEMAIQLNPDFEPVYYDLAGVNIARQEPEKALEVLEAARERFKDLNFTLEFYTAVAKAQQENYSEALPHLVSAELLAKTSEPARLNHIFYYQLGSVHERMGNIEESEEAFRKALELSPDYADAMNYMGYMWADRGENLEEARELIERAVELEPENAAFLDSLAWVLFKLDQPAEALKHMRKAIELTGMPDPTLYDHLGDIQAALKHYEEARAAYEKALEVKADEAIQRKLESLKGVAATP